jgi:serine-type D-Ala-D-Ala carboxypeptidase
MSSKANAAAAGEAGTRARFETAYRVLEEAISARAFPGCAFGVLAGDKVVLEDALGRFTYDADSRAVNAETVFDIASLTKVVATTAMAMILYQRGQLDFETRLGDVLPQFLAGRAAADPARRVTLRHLLAHNSGLPGYARLFETAPTAEALMDTCMRLPLDSEPGTRAEYSDPGFILLGRALETRAAEKLDIWARREIFDRLEMSSTGFCPSAHGQAGSLIPPTEEDTTFRHRRIQGEVQDENAYVLGGVAGHGGVFSCLRDLLRFASEIVNAGTRTDNATRNRPEVEGVRLFEQDTIERFAKRQAPTGSSRALGWDTPSANSSAGKHFSGHSIGHLGYSGCSFWIDLDSRVAIVLLTNRTWPDRQCQLIKTVRPAFHDAVREAL